MDSDEFDEFDDGLADEDLILVEEQARTVTSTSNTSQRQTSQQFRQTTLFGGTLRDDGPAPTQSHNSRVYRVDLPPEQPTHHVLNPEAMRTWVYPMNLGAIRDYQYSIVKNGLFNNTLVALPTGLGKTFIAATIMLNYHRWTKDAKIVFVAPTKPLASQQVEACLGIAGIPRTDVTLLTGEVNTVLRDREWAEKRVFFMTPQTLQNDLSNGRADPKSIVLLVVDEAHRATGDCAYVKVVEFIRRFSKSFRVLALTATPGSSVEGVQAVMDNLGISHIEIRTEASIDLRQYVHQRTEDRIAMPLSDDILHVCELFGKALMPMLKKLSELNIYWGRDPMDITVYGLLKAKQDFQNRQRAAHNPNKFAGFMLQAVVPILQKMAHYIKLLKFHGVAPFYTEISQYRDELDSKAKLGKYEGQLVKDPNFQEMLSTVDKWLRTPEFVSHPKTARLEEELLNHFVNAESGSSTRVIVFSEFRASAEHIIKTINKHRPLLKASIFVGQADSKSSAGMKQKDQIETIEKFRKGEFNILVATSIGEEGLDIGQVDLIIMYDASASPIRMLQRMGRTGRKRAGKIIVLLTKGREEQKLVEAHDNYEKMQQMICDGDRFTFRHDISTRIIPRDIKPEVDKRIVDIPPENTQDKSLPIPKASKQRGQKAAKKKFNMPDGVETGFKSVTSLLGISRTKAKPPAPREVDFLEEMPHLSKVLLTESQNREFRRNFQSMPGLSQDDPETKSRIQNLVVVANRTLHPGHKIGPGRHAKRFVKWCNDLDKDRDDRTRYINPYFDEEDTRWKQIPIPAFADEPPVRGDEAGGSPILLSDMEGDTPAAKPTKPRPKSNPKPRAKPKSKKSPKPKATPKLPSKSRRQADIFSEAEEGVSGEESEEEEDGSSQMASQPARGGRKPTARRARNADTIEDYGDDCMRTSDNCFSDGSDNGSDLADFIVASDKITSSMRETDPTSVSSPYVYNTQKSKPSSIPARAPVSLASTQDSEFEFPELTDLTPKPRGTKRAIESSAEDGHNSVVRAGRTKRRQAVVFSSDADE